MIPSVAAQNDAQDRLENNYFDNYVVSDEVTTPFEVVSSAITYDAPFDRARYDFQNDYPVESCKLVRVYGTPTLEALDQSDFPYEYQVDVTLNFQDLTVFEYFPSLLAGQEIEIIFENDLTYNSDISHTLSIDIIAAWDVASPIVIGVTLTFQWLVTYLNKPTLSPELTFLLAGGAFTVLVVAFKFWRD